MAEYFRGRGSVYLAKRDANGNPGAFFDCGNSSLLRVGFEEEVIEHTETVSGNDLQDLRLYGATKGNISLTVEEHIRANLRAFFRGAAVTVGDTSYASSNFDTAPSGLAVGDIWQLEGRNISSLVITDSAGSPTTLTLNTHYEVVNLKTGKVKIKSLSSLTQPLKAQYTAGGAEATKFLTESPEEYYITFDGKNTAQTPHTECQAEFYRASFNLPAALELLSRETNVGQLEITGGLLRDTARAANSKFGGFGRIISDLAE